MMNFNTLNDEANYYSRMSKTSGVNKWEQDEFQSKMISLIEPCNLTKEQIEKIGNLMVQHNEELDMAPSNNKSVAEFEDFAKNKLSTLEQNKGMIKAA